MIPPIYTSLGQTLGVLPDDMVHWFRKGFFALCEEGSPEAKTRAKAMGSQGSIALWMAALRNAVQAGSREQEDTQLVPVGSRMDYGPGMPTPAYPFPGAWGW